MNYLVLGFRRSCTTYISELIKSHPAVTCLIEPLTLNMDIFRTREFDHWADTEYVPDIFHPLLFKKPTAISFLQDFQDYLLTSRSEYLLGFKEVTLHNKLQWIKKLLPNLKVIYVTRNPLNTIASFKQIGFTKRWNYSEKVLKFVNTSTQLPVGGLPNPSIPDNYDDVEISCMAYKISVQSFLLTHPYRNSEDMMFIKIEDFLQDRMEVATDIMAFLEKNIHPNQREFIQKTSFTTKGGAYSKYRSAHDVNTRHLVLSKTEIEKVKRILVSEFTQLNYDL